LTKPSKSKSEPQAARLPVLLNWQANNTFGWGILGLNIFFQWANDPQLQPLLRSRLGPEDMQMVDPLRQMAIEAARSVSNQFVEKFLDKYSSYAFPVIDALGNGLMPKSEARGSKTIGRCIFEDTNLDHLDTKLAKYDQLLCGSTWNQALLQANCSKPVAMIHEGIDPSLFHPGPRSGVLDPGRFYVFSGGKVEYRKAQDLVLRAFHIFSQRHDDAILVTSWHSPWPAISVGFKGSAKVELRLDAAGRLDILRWAAENGIKRGQVIDVGPIPNALMPSVLREMDCSLQASRAEACTNLPAKEAMACGVPVVLAANTGVLDLVGQGNCFPLYDQRPVLSAPSVLGTVGWGESSVDEIVEQLERIHADSELRRRIGKQGSEWILAMERTWRDHSCKLKAYLLDRAWS
jgi:glycosyltransferase involved in cell wall biosynthesis